jgi:hypothetical protein
MLIHVLCVFLIYFSLPSGTIIVFTIMPMSTPVFSIILETCTQEALRLYSVLFLFQETSLLCQSHTKLDGTVSNASTNIFHVKACQLFAVPH